MLHGFRWPRAGFTGIRVYVVLHNLEEAAAEYIQQPLTTKLITESFNKTQPDLLPRLPELRFIEQYDPNDESSNTVSQDYAYVGAKVVVFPDGGGLAPAPGAGPGLNIEDVVEQGSGLTDDQTAALEELRDRLAPGEKIGWFMVYNGDPERWYPPSEDEEEEYDEGESEVDEQSEVQSHAATEPSTPQSYTVCIDEIEVMGLFHPVWRFYANVSRLFTGSFDETLQPYELFLNHFKPRRRCHVMNLPIPCFISFYFSFFQRQLSKFACLARKDRSFTNFNALCQSMLP